MRSEVDRLWAIAAVFAAASDRCLKQANECANALQRSQLLERAALQAEESDRLAVRARLAQESEAL